MAATTSRSATPPQNGCDYLAAGYPSPIWPRRGKARRCDAGLVFSGSNSKWGGPLPGAHSRLPTTTKVIENAPLRLGIAVASSVAGFIDYPGGGPSCDLRNSDGASWVSPFPTEALSQSTRISFKGSASQAQAPHSKALVSRKKRSVLSSLVWSNLPKRTFSGLSFPRPPRPGFQAGASQAQASHSMAVASLKKRSVLSSLVWSNLPKRTFSGVGLQDQVSRSRFTGPGLPFKVVVSLKKLSVLKLTGMV